MTIDEDIDLLRECVETNDTAREDGPPSYTDAFNRLLTERSQMIANLSSTHGRCTELLDRARQMTPDEILATARAVLGGQTRSFVQDAETMARWILSETIKKS